jgi:CRP-like cAMP-binding protein
VHRLFATEHIKYLAIYYNKNLASNNYFYVALEISLKAAVIERFIMSSSHDPRQNHLLAALSAEDYARLEPHLELVPMLYVMKDGASAEIAVVGNEGVIGIALFMGGESTPSRAVTQSAGYAYRMKSQLLKQEFNRAGPVMHLLLRYTQALITQMAQTAVCNRHHSVDQQLCRWLLLSLDRLQSNQLSMTQELIANMLGVRREGVTEAARKLQSAGLISYQRGHITALDRPGLEARSCECYAVDKKEFDRLLPKVVAR